MKKTTTSWHVMLAKLMAAVVAAGTVIGLVVVSGANAQDVTPQADSESVKAAEALSADGSIHKPLVTKLMGYNARASWIKEGLRTDFVLRVGRGDVVPSCIGLATGEQSKSDKSSAVTGVDEQGKCGLQLFVGDGLNVDSKNVMRRVAYMNTLKTDKTSDADVQAATAAWNNATGNFFTIHHVDSPEGQNYDNLTISLKTTALSNAAVDALKVYGVVNHGTSHPAVVADADAQGDVVIPDGLVSSDYAAEAMRNQTFDANGLSWCGDASSITCVNPKGQATVQDGTNTGDSAASDSSSSSSSSPSKITLSDGQPTDPQVLNYVKNVEVSSTKTAEQLSGGLLRMDFVVRVKHGSIRPTQSDPGIMVKFARDGKDSSTVAPAQYISLSGEDGAKNWATQTNDKDVFTIHSVTPVRSGQPNDPVQFDNVSISVKSVLRYDAKDVDAGALGGTEKPLYVYAIQGVNPGDQVTPKQLNDAGALNVAQGHDVWLYTDAECAQGQPCNGPRLTAGTKGAVKFWWDSWESSKDNPGHWTHNNSGTDSSVSGDSVNWGLDLRSNSFGGDKSSEGYAPMSSFMVNWHNPALQQDKSNDVAGSTAKYPHNCAKVSGFYFQWVGTDRQGNWVPVKDLTPTAQKRDQKVMSNPSDEDLGHYSASNNAGNGAGDAGKKDLRPGTWKVDGTRTPRQQDTSISGAQHSFGKIDFLQARKDQPELNGYFKLVTWPVTESDDAACSVSDTTGSVSLFNPLGSDTTGVKAVDANSPDAATQYAANQAIIDKGSSIDSAFYNYSFFDETPTIDTPAEGQEIPEVKTLKLEGHSEPNAKIQVYRTEGDKPFDTPADTLASDTSSDSQLMIDQDTKKNYVVADKDGKWTFTDKARSPSNVTSVYKYRARQFVAWPQGSDLSTSTSLLCSDFSNVRTLKITGVNHAPRLFKMLNYINRIDTDDDDLRMDFIVRVAHNDVNPVLADGAQKNMAIYYAFNTVDNPSKDNPKIHRAVYQHTYTPKTTDTSAVSTTDNKPLYDWTEMKEDNDYYTINSVVTSGLYDYLNISVKGDLDYDNGVSNVKLGGSDEKLQYVYFVVGSKTVAALSKDDKVPTFAQLQSAEAKTGCDDRGSNSQGSPCTASTKDDASNAESVGGAINVANALTPDSTSNLDYKKATVHLYGKGACDEPNTDTVPEGTSGLKCNGPRIATGTLYHTPGDFGPNNGKVLQTWSKGLSNWGLTTDKGFTGPEIGHLRPGITEGASGSTAEGVAPGFSFWNMWYNPALVHTHDPFAQYDKWSSSIDSRKGAWKVHPCSQVSSFYFQWFGLDRSNRWVPVKALTPTAQWRTQNPLSSWKGDAAITGVDHDRQQQYSARNGSWASQHGHEFRESNGEIIVPYQLRQNITPLQTDDNGRLLKKSDANKDPDNPYMYWTNQKVKDPKNPGADYTADITNSFGDIDFKAAKAQQPDLTGYFKMVSWPVSTDVSVTSKDNKVTVPNCSASADEQKILNPLLTQADMDDPSNSTYPGYAKFDPEDPVKMPAQAKSDSANQNGAVRGVTLTEAQNNPKKVDDLISEGISNDSAFYDYTVPIPNKPKITSPENGDTVDHVKRTISGISDAPDDSIVKLYQMSTADSTDVGSNLIGSAKVEGGKWSIEDDRFIDDTVSSNLTLIYRATVTEPIGYNLVSELSDPVTVKINAYKADPPSLIDDNGAIKQGNLVVPAASFGKLYETDKSGKRVNKKVIIKGTYNYNLPGARVVLYALPLKSDGTPAATVKHDAPDKECPADADGNLLSSEADPAVICGGSKLVEHDATWSVSLDATQFAEPDRSVETAGGTAKQSQRYIRYRVVAAIVNKDDVSSDLAETSDAHPAIIDMRAPVVKVTNANWGAYGQAWHASENPEVTNAGPEKGTEWLPKGSVVVVEWPKDVDGKHVAPTETKVNNDKGEWYAPLPKGVKFNDADKGEITAYAYDAVQAKNDESDSHTGNQSARSEAYPLTAHHVSSLPLTGGWIWVLITLFAIVVLAIVYKFMYPSHEKKHSLKAIGREELSR